MSLEDNRINSAWAALHCGDHGFLQELLPDRESVQKKIQHDKHHEEIGFDAEELLIEFADNYWGDEDGKELNQTVVASENGLLRCVIWPQSSFSFEGRAYLTKLDAENERMLSANIRAELESETVPNREIGSPLLLQAYSGQWRFEGENIIAEVTSGDFGIFTIEAIVKPTKDLSARPDFLKDVEQLLNRLAK